MIKFIGDTSGLECGIKQIDSFLHCADTTVTAKKIDCGLKVSTELGNAEICYGSVTDFFRGVLTLIKMCGKKSEVSEQSSLSQLGAMIDCSRNAVLKVDKVKELANMLALMGYSSLQLYTEDTIEVQNEPYFGYMRGRYTANEIKELDIYCKNLGIELVPCIQTLAHLNQIARYDSYSPIIDFGDILLAGSDRTYELIENIIKSVAANFTSRKINIGMDEAHMLGLGKYLDKNGYHTRYEIMLEHLKKVGAILEKYGFVAEMWSDMFFRLIFSGEYYAADINKIPADMLKNIPQNIKLLYWDYYSTDVNKYDTMIRNHKAISSNIGFAGGAWKWTGFAPDNRYSIAATQAAFTAVKKHNIDYVIMTAWGDNGGEASVFSVLPALLCAADIAYCGSFDSSGVEALTGSSYDSFLLLDKVNQVANNPVEMRTNPSKYFLYDDLFYGTFQSLVPQGAAKYYSDLAAQLKSVKGGKFSYLFNTIASLSCVLAEKVELSYEIKIAYDNKDKKELKKLLNQVDRLKAALTVFKSAVYAQWQTDNKPFGIEVQHVRLGGIIERIGYVYDSINNYVNGNIDKISELDEQRLDYAYSESRNGEFAYHNIWKDIISPSIV